MKFSELTKTSRLNEAGSKAEKEISDLFYSYDFKIDAKINGNTLKITYRGVGTILTITMTFTSKSTFYTFGEDDMSYPSPNILPTVKSLEKLITFATEHEIEIKNIFLAH